MRRRLLITIVIAIVGLVPGANAQPTTAAPDPISGEVRAQLLAARDAIWRGWFRNDSATLARMLPPAAAAGGGSGWQNRDAIVAEARQFAASGARLVDIRFANTRMERQGNVVVIFSDYTLETEREEQRTRSMGRATEVFVLENGVWTNPFWYLGR